MSDPSAEDVIDAFVGAVRDQLEQGHEVEIPELGTLRIEHRPSEMTTQQDERTVSPPQDVVVFDPEQ